MGNKTGIMSEGLKEEIAKELGVYDQVQKRYFTSISFFAVANQPNLAYNTRKIIE